MAKFKLQPVLKLRKHREDGCQRELAIVLAAELAEKNRVLRMANLRQEQSQTLRRQQQAGPLDIAAVLDQKRYLGLLDREITLRLGKVAEAEKVTASYREKMLAAMRDRKALEILESRWHEAGRREEARRDTVAMDEVGLRIARQGEVAHD